MTLKEQLADDMKTAMRARDMLTLNAIRFLQAEIRNLEIDHGVQDDVGVQKIIARQIKQMKDAVAEYKKGNREDLVTEEEAKIAVITKYLPQQMSDDELKAVVQKVMADNPGRPVGQLIGQVMKQTAGQADGNRASDMVKALQ